MVGNKHAFFSSIFVEKGSSIIAYTYNGAFYYWKRNERDWKSLPIVHGHFNGVMDVDWDKSQAHSYIVSTSEDQTTRLYAYWKEKDSWHEINRPQIHGYDINTVAILNQWNEGRECYTCKIVSGADEKIIRIFDPPFNLVKFIQNLSKIDLIFNKEHDNSYYEKCNQYFNFRLRKYRR